MTLERMVGPDVVLDPSAVRAYLDSDPRVMELVDNLGEDGHAVRVLRDSLADALPATADASVMVQLSALMRTQHVRLVELPDVLQERAERESERLGVAPALVAAALYAKDHLFHIATWQAGLVTTVLGDKGVAEELLVDLASRWGDVDPPGELA